MSPEIVKRWPIYQPHWFTSQQTSIKLNRLSTSCSIIQRVSNVDMKRRYQIIFSSIILGISINPWPFHRGWWNDQLEQISKRRWAEWIIEKLCGGWYIPAGMLVFFSVLFYFLLFSFHHGGGGGGGEEFFSRKTNSLKYTFYFFPDYFGFCCCCCWISILLSKPSVTWLYIVDDCRPCAAAAAVMSVATVPRLMMSTALPVIYGHSFQHFILCGACR